MSLLCTLGFHSWSPWKVTKRGEVSAPSKRNPERQRVIGETIVQERVCSSCGRIEIDTQHVDLV